MNSLCAHALTRAQTMILLMERLDHCRGLVTGLKLGTVKSEIEQTMEELAEALWKESPGEMVDGALCPDCVRRIRDEALRDTPGLSLGEAQTLAIADADRLTYLDPRPAYPGDPMGIEPPEEAHPGGLWCACCAEFKDRT